MAGNLALYLTLEQSQALKEWDYLWDQVAKGSEYAKDIINKNLGGTRKEIIEVIIDPKTNQKIGEQVKVLRSEYDKIEKQRNKVNQSEKGSLSNLRQSVNTLKQQRDGILKYKQGVNASGKSVRVVRKEWTAANQKVKEAVAKLREAQGIKLGNITLPSFDGITGIASKFNAVFAAVQGVVSAVQTVGQVVGAAVQRATQVSQLELAFQSFGVSAEQSSKILNDAKAISLGYGVSLESVEKSYKRLTPVILQNGGSVEETSEVIKALSARMTGLGLNADQSNRYIEAFAQVMGKGKLQGEELNQQFAEIDGSLRGQVAQYVKAAYGIEDFEGAMKRGEITSDIFKEAILDAASSIQDNLAGQFGNLQARISDLNPAQIKEIGKTLDTLSLDNLNKTFGETGRIFAGLGLFVKEFFADITGNFPDINNFFAFVGQFLGATLYGIVAGIAAIIKSIVSTLDSQLKYTRQIVTSFGQFVDLIQQAVLKFFGLQEWFQNLPGWIKNLLNPAKAIGDYMNNFKQRSIEAREALASALPKITDISNQVKAIELSQIDVTTATQKTVAEREKELAAVRRTLAAQKEAFEEQKKIIEAQIEAVKEQEEIAVQAIQDRIEKEREAHQERLSQLQEQKGELQEQLQLVRDRKAEELAELDAPSAEAKRLLEIRRQELQLKANNVQLSEKERLEAKVALQEMDKRIKRAEINNRYKKEERDLQAQIKDKDAEIRAEKEKQAKIIAELQKDIKETREIYAAQVRALENVITQARQTFELKEKELAAAEDNLQAIKDSKGAAGELNTALDPVVTKTGNAADNAGRLYDNLDKASKVKINIPTARFAGGPVTAGKTYSVNELGQEAFLSAAGKLSMIKAPAWGQWKAPSSGTIIPAHLASQLNIPKGGVNLNAITGRAGTGSINTIRASSNRSSSVGDRIVNNVTIQSTAPAQDATDVLLNLVRQRRAFRR